MEGQLDPAREQPNSSDLVSEDNEEVVDEDYEDGTDEIGLGKAEDMFDDEGDSNDEIDEEEDVEDEDYISAIPIDWSPPDSPANVSNYKVALRQIAESIAGQLGEKMPVFIAQNKSGGMSSEKSQQDWLPSSLQKKCAPASSFLIKLVSDCDMIFLEINKNNLDKKKGLLLR